MTNIAAAVVFVYGLVSLCGGIQGYVVKKSTASLVAGGISGVILVAATVLLIMGRGWSLWVALLVSAALVGRFLPAYLKDTQNVWPALVMAILGATTVVTCLLALIASKRG
jgi:uncharacterized membrane protein (UPF0136 family)